MGASASSASFVVVAQFIDRGLSLLVPLKVGTMLDVTRIAVVMDVRSRAFSADLGAVLKDLEKRTKKVQGVQEVENLLHVPGTPAPTK